LRSEVHLTAPGTTLVVAKRIETTIRRSKLAGRPDQANWISAGWLNMAGNSIKSFVTSWKVPAAPIIQSSQLLYLFNGMEPMDASTIVQPVLQWGDSGPDEDGVNRTGQVWTVASWIVPAPDGQTYHTPHVPVNPGDTLVGAITLVQKSAGGYVYSCEFQGLPATRFSTPAISELIWCSETLEAYELSGAANPPYDLNSASEYPAEKFTTFEGINISFDGTQNNGFWTTTDYEAKFGEFTELVTNSVSNGEIRIHYGAEVKGSFI
jgi:hypothetical protein